MSDQQSAVGQSSWFGKFLSFESLIGQDLIKFVYFAGLVVGAIVTIILMFASLASAGSSRGLGLMGLFVFPLIAAFALIVWRFYCELAILLFQMYHRMGEIRDRLPPA